MPFAEKAPFAVFVGRRGAGEVVGIVAVCGRVGQAIGCSFGEMDEYALFALVVDGRAERRGQLDAVEREFEFLVAVDFEPSVVALAADDDLDVFDRIGLHVDRDVGSLTVVEDFVVGNGDAGRRSVVGHGHGFGKVVGLPVEIFVRAHRVERSIVGLFSVVFLDCSVEIGGVSIVVAARGTGDFGRIVFLHRRIGRAGGESGEQQRRAKHFRHRINYFISYVSVIKTVPRLRLLHHLSEISGFVVIFPAFFGISGICAYFMKLKSSDVKKGFGIVGVRAVNGFRSLCTSGQVCPVMFLHILFQPSDGRPEYPRL